MKSNKTLRIAVFLDGSPGHEKQTLGIVEQLKKQIDIQLLSCTVEKLSKTTQIANTLAHLCGVGKSIECKIAGADLALGTGTYTHLPMLLAKKHYHIPVVVCMTPASYLLGRFDLVFAPHHDNVGDNEKIVKTIGPPNTNQDKKQHQEDKVLILIGGTDSKSHIWESDSIVKSVEALISYEVTKKVVISSSPRTPAETENKLADIAKKHGEVEFFRFRDTPSGWIEMELSRCKYVWVTGDSISMVYEALSSGCKVGIIPVAWKSKKSKFSRSEKFLNEKRLTVGLDSYLLGRARWKSSTSLNEAKRCADEILRRWG